MNKLFYITLCALLIAPLQAADKKELATKAKTGILKNIQKALITQNISNIFIYPSDLS